MSSPSKPGQQKLLPLTDPNNVQEVFAHECSGVQVRGDGTCHFTFSVFRPGHQMPGVMRNDPDEVRAVSMRLVMPTPAVGGMLKGLQQVQAAMAQHQAASQPPKAN